MAVFGHKRPSVKPKMPDFPGELFVSHADDSSATLFLQLADSIKKSNPGN
jgi:hypothetical protein